MQHDDSQEAAENSPQPTAAATPNVAANTAPTQQAQAQPASTEAATITPPRKLSGFLKVSIVLLATVSIASIALLFIGEFEGKFERVFSTFCAFAVFVGLTAFDTRRTQRHEWYPPVALIANSYILALLLIITWMTATFWAFLSSIFWKSVLVILVARAVVACSQVLMNMAVNRPKPLGVFGLITSLLATLTGFLFTAPLAIDVFDINIPELYWRFAVTALLLTALSLSITLLLRWAYGGPEREAAKRARAVAQVALAQPQPESQPFPGLPAPAEHAPAQQQVPPAGQVQPLLPWPTFADGRPLPVGADGQPDFSVLPR